MCTLLIEGGFSGEGEGGKQDMAKKLSKIRLYTSVIVQLSCDTMGICELYHRICPTLRQGAGISKSST